MDSSVSPKDEIWFLRVCHHISTGLYHSTLRNIAEDRSSHLHRGWSLKSRKSLACFCAMSSDLKSQSSSWKTPAHFPVGTWTFPAAMGPIQLPCQWVPGLFPLESPDHLLATRDEAVGQTGPRQTLQRGRPQSILNTKMCCGFHSCGRRQYY